MSNLIPPFRKRSFVRRGRRTEAQERAFAALWPLVGIPTEQAMLDFNALFGRSAPVFLEIGFGSGQSLVAAAMAHPDKNFIGVETHQPGIGALCLAIEKAQLTNIRIYNGDVIDLLTTRLPPASLDGIQLFFPDPWPKRRHHDRRLIQPNAVKQLVNVLKPQGQLHLATDWEDYAKQMMQVLLQEEKLINMMSGDQFASRSPYRPIETKFERRALREHRKIWELQFKVGSR